MVRKILAGVSLMAALVGGAAPLSAACNQGYVKIYNYTEDCLQIYVDGRLYGHVNSGTAAHWLPVEYGMHKVEIYKNGRGTFKYLEVSYSYPNAEFTVGRYDL